MYTVYKHTAPNGKTYIGITGRDPVRRWGGGSNYRSNKHFFSAIQLYGWENIKHEIIATGLSKEAAAALEIELIEQYDSTNREKGYNESTGGEAPAAGSKHSEETRRKMSESRKGRRLSEAARQKMSRSAKGRRLSEEQKEKMRGANNRFYGKASPNRKAVICIETGITYESISEAAKATGAQQQKISRVCNGKNHTAGGFHWAFIENPIPPPAELPRSGGIKKAVICIETGTIYNTLTEAAAATGAQKTNISSACKGKVERAGGYHWKYLQEG